MTASLAGRLAVGMSDVREGASTFGASRMLVLSSEQPELLLIPPGIAHGFYAPEHVTFVYGVSSYWDPQHDELGCRWDDPGLGLAWGAIEPLLSQRDSGAPSRAALLARLRDLRPEW